MGCSATKLRVQDSVLKSTHREPLRKTSHTTSKPQYIFTPSQYAGKNEVKHMAPPRSPSVISVQSASSRDSKTQWATIKNDDAKSDVPSCGSLADVTEFHDLGVIPTFTPECTHTPTKSCTVDEREHPFMAGTGREQVTSACSTRLDDRDSPAGSDTDSVLKFCSFVPDLA